MHGARFPAWFFQLLVLVLAAHLLAGYFTDLTIGAMGGVSEFARAVRRLDLERLSYYRPVAYAVALAFMLSYLRPVLVYFRDPAEPPSELVQRRVVNTPVVVAMVGFASWMGGMVLGIASTVLEFGRWSPELLSQHVFSPMVNSFLAVTTTYLLTDWLFRVRVIPKVFVEGQPFAVSGSLVPGVSARLFVTLIAVAFIPLFTMLGLVRSGEVRFAAGMPISVVMPELNRASGITFVVFVVLGVGLALVFSRSLTGRMREIASALRRVQAGDLAVRVEVTSGDEIGVLEDGLNSMVAALRDKERILGTFGRVVEPAVRDHLLSGEARLGGELRAATILFCDLRGFTALSEVTPPAEVVETLNEFFTSMTAWVRTCNGFVDKFIGDSLLVVFGLFGSDDGREAGAVAALRCGLGIHDRLEEINRRRATRDRAPLAVSIGIHTGEVLAGTIGAEDRHEYTVIGDTVNVAARLQQECKERGAALLASRATWERARSMGYEAPLEPLDAVSLRGRSEPVAIVGRR